MRLVAAALVLAVTAVPAAGQPSISLASGEALLSIEARGVARTRPDVMTMRAGAVTAGATAEEAVAANAEMAQRLIAAVRSSGVDARDIRTADFRVEPRFEEDRDSGRVGSDGRPPRIVGYVAENMVEFRLRDLSRAQQLVGRLFAEGANRVDGPRFSLADDRAARRVAERNAIEEARAEAENYAAAVGQRLGRIIRISDRRAWTEPHSDAVVVTGNLVRAVPVEPGEIETVAVVYVDFALVPQ